MIPWFKIKLTQQAYLTDEKEITMAVLNSNIDHAEHTCRHEPALCSAER
jgi:hypothetical protein